MMGARECFDRLYQQQFSRVYAYFASCFGREYAEDLSQQVFMKLWGYLNRENAIEPESWQAWIFRVAVNEKNDFLRQKQRSLPAGVYENEAQEEPDTQSGEERSVTALAVRSSLRGLDAGERELLLLRSIGFTSREMGELLQLPDSTLRSRIQQAKKHFQQRLLENGVDEYG